MNKKSLKISNILHINNTLDFGGVEKTVYQICLKTKDDFNTVCAASTGGVFAKKIEELGVRHYTIPDLSTRKPNEIITIIRILKRIIKYNHIDIIECHHRMAVLYARLLAPNKIIIYDDQTTYFNKGVMSSIILKDINVVAVSNQVKRNAMSLFKVHEENIAVINNAVNEFDGVVTEVNEFRDDHDQGYFIAIYPGRIHHQKAMNYYVDAAKILKDRGCRIRFYIIGEGELEQDIRNQIESLGLKDIVRIWKFRDDIKNVMKQSDVVVLTSIFEGLPLMPMDAFSVGKAVIATNVEGTDEVIQDGYNGLLVENRNPEAIADGIQRVYDNRELLSELNRNAEVTYSEKFNLDVFRDSYIRYYEGLIRNN